MIDAAHKWSAIGKHGGVSSPEASREPARERSIPRRQKRPTTLRSRMTRTLQAIVALFLLNYVALPQIAGLRRAVKRLSEVNGVLLVAGLAFELAALVCYSQLTRVALGTNEVTLRTMLRIQLATKAITNTVPGGSAAGSALGYRLMTLAGVDSAGAGFALATAGLGSAVVLNLLLWLTLLVSIPLSGINPVYVTTALVGVIVLGAFGAVVLALVRGAERAERIVRSFAAHFSFLDPDKVGGIIRRFAERLKDLATRPALLGRLVSWALLNWVLDAVSLWVFLRAFEVSVRPDSLLVAFCVANVSAAIPLTPGGLGVLDLTLTSMLAFFGVAGTAIALGVPTYRLASFWLPIPLGLAAYLSLRVGPFRLERGPSLARLRDEAGPLVATGETVYDWTDRVGVPRVVSAAAAAAARGGVVILADRAAPGSVRVSTNIEPPLNAPSPRDSAEERSGLVSSDRPGVVPGEVLAPESLEE